MRSGFIRPQQPLGRRAEVQRLLRRHAHAAAERSAAARRRAAAAGRTRAFRGLGAACRAGSSLREPACLAEVVMPPPPRRVGTATISMNVGQVSISSSYVPTPTTPAVLQHDDLVGVGDGGHPLRDDDHRLCPWWSVAAPPAAGRRWPGRAPRTSRRTGRCSAARPAPWRSPGAAADRRRRWSRPG